MKTLLIADNHGKRALDFVRQKFIGDIEQAVFLGDYGAPEVIKDLIDLDLEKKFILGNQELNYFSNIGIGGESREHHSNIYTNLWKNFPNEKRFILEAISQKIPNAGLTLEEEIECGSKIAYCHGGIVDKDASEEEIFNSIWQRMMSIEIIKRNFYKMKEKNYEILFRGHDHEYSTIELNDSNNTIKKTIERKVKLSKGNRYVVSVGSFYYGDYAIFDSNTREIEHKNIMDD